MLSALVKFFLENKLITILLALGLIVMGFIVMPFDVKTRFFIREPVPVDAIPDIGENQQIVFSEWPGRSPQDVEDQVTYPLTIALQGIPGVKSIRSYSAFGFSTIYVIFKEKVDFYWSRSRVLERLNVAQKDLPEGVVPVLGPDATALGQIFWYTLEGEGFDLQELRSIQDWYVKYALQAVEGVSEVASVGGYVKEYQIDLDPDAMRHYGVGLRDVMTAVKRSNIDVGAKTIDFNGVEYVVRGLGFIKALEDLEHIVVKERNYVPVYLKNVADVHLGPALRRGALNKQGAEVVGGVVVARYGENPLAVINRVKQQIERISPGLPKKTLPDGRTVQVRIVPFYDRTDLIHETLATLQEALSQEILITIIVILLFLRHFSSAVIVSATLPLAVLAAFVMMKIFKVDANIMSLAGIAIAIGTIVDMGIIMCENILRHLTEAPPQKPKTDVVFEAAKEVASAVVTAISTTIISFLAVFAMSGPEGKLFKPLAFTKTFVLTASILLALFLVPTLADWWLKKPSSDDNKSSGGTPHRGLNRRLVAAAGLVVLWALWRKVWWLAGVVVLTLGLRWGWARLPEAKRSWLHKHIIEVSAGLVLLFLTMLWRPLGAGKGYVLNLFFVGGCVVALIGGLFAFMRVYPSWLTWCLSHKRVFGGIVCGVCLWGLLVWQGVPGVLRGVLLPLKTFGLETKTWALKVSETPPFVWVQRVFPGLGKEFMPPFDEGSFLFMPTTMPHASISSVLRMLALQDLRISRIPEVKEVVGKIGRVESALDPAPLSMVETVVLYRPEYGRDPKTGRRVRLWRDHIRSPKDIWKEILKAGELPGMTTAPMLQPIAARIVMLQSGMRAPMGVKVMGKDLKDIERTAAQIERLLKEVPEIVPETVIADRIVGKPYIEFAIDRERIARYGVNIRDVQDVIEAGIGGMRMTTTVEGRERYPVRIRFKRELRDNIEAMQEVPVPTRSGAFVPLKQVARLKYERGPQVIKSEDTFLVGYVLFDKRPDVAEVDAVEAAQSHLAAKLRSGEFQLPAGVTYKFAGSYENQIRSQKTLAVVLPASLLIIFLILYLQFRRVTTALLVFSGIGVAFAGGFILMWFYGQPWFAWLPFIGDGLREVFNMRAFNLSVAVWVGFLALFGVASDNGVVMATYLDQAFAKNRPRTIAEIHAATLQASLRRLRPCMMTTATTILALLPVLTSTGRGADIMIPMALPSVGGMSLVLLTFFIVPVGYAWFKERELLQAARVEQHPMSS